MQESKKVLFIHHGSAFGGAPMSLLYTALGIRKYGYIPEVALVQPSPELHELYNNHDIPTHELIGFPRYFYLSGDSNSIFSVIALKKIAGFIFKYRGGKKKLSELVSLVEPDIIHLNSIVLAGAARMLRKMQRSFVWHVREYGPPYKDFRLSYIRRQILLSEKVIFLSNGEMRSWLGSEKHGVVVSNFVNLSDFNQKMSKVEARKKIEAPSKFTLLYVGGLNPIKGPELLIETLKKIKSRGLDFHCLMPGAISKKEQNGEGVTAYEQKIIKNITESGLSEICMRLPFDSEVKKYYSASDVLIFPAKFPHFARPVVEASAMSLPVVVNNIEPLDELVLHGETGFLSEPKSDDIAEYIITLVESPELRKKMGAKGRLFAKDKFDADKQISKIVKYYEMKSRNND